MRINLTARSVNLSIFELHHKGELKKNFSFEGFKGNDNFVKNEIILARGEICTRGVHMHSFFQSLPFKRGQNAKYVGSKNNISFG